MNAYMRSHTTIQFKLKVALTWCDKKDVWMLSTSYSDDLKTKKINYQTDKPKRKPKCVADYNAFRKKSAAHGARLTSDNAALTGLNLPRIIVTLASHYTVNEIWKYFIQHRRYINKKFPR